MRTFWSETTMLLALLLSSPAVFADGPYDTRAVENAFNSGRCGKYCELAIIMFGAAERVTFQALPTDVNGDRLVDYIATTPNACGLGNCIEALLVSMNEKHRIVFIAQNISFLPSHSNGYRDLTFGFRGAKLPSYSTGKFEYPLFQWNGRRYVERGSVIGQ